VPQRPAAVPRPAPPREPEPVTEVMRAAPAAPTQIMRASAWTPPPRVTARQPLLMPPSRTDAAPPPRRRRRRTGLVVFVTLLALAGGAAGAVALSDLGRNRGSGTSTLTEPTADDAATLPGAGATTGPVQNADDQTRRKPRRKARLRQQPTQAPTEQPAPEASESVTPPPDTEEEGGGEPSVAPGDVEQNGELAPDDADADPGAVP
jgi:hypothetical protein